MEGTILISGIHGVGKTTAVNKISTDFLIPNYTASKIIREFKEVSSEFDSKRVSNVDENQRILLAGVEKLKRDHKIILLDGHFVLLNRSSNIEKIDISVFKGLSLIGVILLIEKPEVIYNRLILRGDNSLSPDLIEVIQKSEIEHAEFITNSLKVPLYKLQSYKDDELFLTMKNVLNPAH